MGVWGGCESCQYLATCSEIEGTGAALMCEDVYRGEYIPLTRADKRINVYPSNWGVNGVICS